MTDVAKEPVLPKRIKPLDPQLVNRIAAGEIIQRPFNALKELIENCLDAGSTSVSINIKEGGLKLIQIQDNGCGIDKDDLKIVCERFTTSKLKEFEDLKEINTFGFRGEALASISHVSRLTIVSRTQKSPCAYKAQYADGKLVGSIKPCASAFSGTQITVEDLFYNSSIRRNALRNSSEEFSKINETVSRYALHNYHVSFFLKRIGENGVDLKTPGCQSKENKNRCEENETVLLDNIALVYGNDCRKELQRISIDYDENYKFEMNGYASNSKYTQLRQMVFILFINERLVDCQPIRKALQGVYNLYMPKNCNYFVYMNLKMNPTNLDVNIHPTKHEVRFLYQDEIINKIQANFEEKMLNSSVSRTYCAKNLTLDTFIETKRLDTSLNDSNCEHGNAVKIYPYQMTRVDHKERKIDTYIKSSKNESFQSASQLNQSLSQSSSQSTKSQSLKPVYDKENNKFNSSIRQNIGTATSELRSFNFKSLNELRITVENNASKAIYDILQSMNFVGFVNRELALIQHQTGLYLTNTRLLSEELFYQIALFNFGNFGYYKLAEPVLITDLATMALDNPESEWSPDDGSKERLSTRCATFLKAKSKILDDYFSIKITTLKDENNADQVYLESIPILLDNYEPDLMELPLFIIRLATEVNWKEEKECFKSLCRQLGIFYAMKNPIDEENESSQTNKKEDWMTEHVLYAAFRNMLLVSSQYEKESFFKLVDLSRLYRVFERC